MKEFVTLSSFIFTVVLASGCGQSKEQANQNLNNSGIKNKIESNDNSKRKINLDELKKNGAIETKLELKREKSICTGGDGGDSKGVN